jgi:hypothetical protein
MRNYLIILIFFSCQHSFCQEWIHYYGWTQNSEASYCIEHYDKGYILSGRTNAGNFGWIIKTDINGNELWDIRIGKNLSNTGIANVEQTNDNGFILCGSTNIFSTTYTDPYIMKLNSCGEVEWCRVLVYDNTGDLGISVKQIPDGGYLFCGEFFGNNPHDRIRLFKFNSEGDMIWRKYLNGDSLVWSEDVVKMVADDSTVLLTGSCYYPNWEKPYYIQTDTAGNELWTLAYSQHTGLGYVGDAWTSVRDRFGNYYSAGGRDAYTELLKFSSSGYEMMTKDLIPGTMLGEARTIHMQNDTNLIIDASWTFNGTDSYLALLKTDTLGNVRKQKYLPNPDNSGIDWSLKTFDNKILAIGTDYYNSHFRIELFKFNSELEYDSIYTRHFTYDSLCPHPITSHTIVPDCGVLVNVDEPFDKPETSALKVFPNPANQKITVEFPKHLVVKNGNAAFGSTTVYERWKSTTLEVFDLSGKRILEKEIVRAQTTMELDVSAWHGGIYYFRLMYNGRTVSGEKVIIEEFSAK